MIRHLFRLMWNKKRAHALLLVEIWASFVVLFGLLTLVVVNVRNYHSPLGFAYERVWAINLGNNQDTIAVAQKTQAVFRLLKSYPAIESVSRMSDTYPFSSYHNGMGVSRNKVVTQMEFYAADENFARTLSMSLTAGAWYRGVDSVSKYRPVVINQRAAESLFGNDNAVGKTISDYKGEKEVWRVAGVVETFKGRGDFSPNQSVMIELLDESSAWQKTLLIRVKPSTDAVLEAKLVKDITAMVPGWSVDVNYLTERRRIIQNQTLVPVLIFLIVSGFLLVNVALGLFGVLNLSIARRKSEIGVRRAMGATAGAITRQFVGEIWVLATFGLLFGLVLAIQFPLLNVFDLEAGVYLTAIGVSILVIYALVTLCSLYPSRQAARVQPSVALHEE
jgi:putative ABC transport system permease protein